eukprot:212792-Rhodomonas_salina.3
MATDIGLRVLQRCSGTTVLLYGLGATVRRHGPKGARISAIGLRAKYAQPGTDLQRRVLSAYARPMHSPVLSRGMRCQNLAALDQELRAVGKAHQVMQMR